MGEAHCICKEKPCRCFNGWGTHFRTPGQLLAAISGEIGMTHYRREWETEEWEVEEEYAIEDEDGVIEMWEEGYNALEISWMAGFTLQEVRHIIKKEKARRKREGRTDHRTGGIDDEWGS